MNRIVMASRRFQKDYQEFRKKYDDLDHTLHDFLGFRAEHRPDEPFGPKDSRMPGSKFRRCHLVHGKAILIYQLHGSEVRLVAVEEHNAIESGSNRPMFQYAKSLQPEDYYTFDVNDLFPTTDEPVMSDPIPAPEPITVTQSEPIIQTEPVQPQTEPVQPEPIVEPAPQYTNGNGAANGSNPLWNDKMIDYLTDRQMLYVPRPARPVIPFILEREVIAPRGDVLIFDPAAQTVHHLSRAEFEAGYQPHSRHTTDVGEAFAVAVQPKQAPAPMQRPTAATAVKPKIVKPKIVQPEIVVETVPPVGQSQARRRPARKSDVGSQIGRLMAVMAHVQRVTQSNKVDSATMREYLQERDVNGLPTTLFNAQAQGFVKKVGPRPGAARAFYYCLTAMGEKKVKLLGDWPFTAVGQKVPFSSQQTVAA